jgi:hypothetical protein
MPPYTAFTAYTFTATSTVLIVVATSILKPFITVRQLNIANTSEIFSNVSSKVDTCSTRLSAIETKVDAGLVSTTQTSRLTSSIHKHCYIATKEEKDCTKKIYFYKYCPP